MHPNLRGERFNYNCDSYIDVSDYPDACELMVASDVLITDYSSMMFEFPAVERKPVFCYANDLHEYDRGFYFDIKDLPFPFANTNKELISYIDHFEQNKYEDELITFYSRLAFVEDGKAAERTVDYLLGVTDKK